MTRKQRQKSRTRAHSANRHLTTTEFRAVAFVATLILAGIVVVSEIKDPVVWGFLGTAIGLSMGQPIR